MFPKSFPKIKKHPLKIPDEKLTGVGGCLGTNLSNLPEICLESFKRDSSENKKYP